MKYLFHLFNIACLTATMFLLVETLYKHLDAVLIGSNYKTTSGNTVSGDIASADIVSGNDQSSRKYVAAPPFTHYEIINNRDIFRTSGKVTDRKDAELISEKEIASLEKTDLKLKLWGTVTSGTDLENYAVIETDKDKKQGLYKKGDEIEGAAIKKILRFSVILTRNGKDERLEMAEESQSQKSSHSASANKKPSTSISGEAEDKINVSIKRSLIEDSMKDINALMNQVRVRPHFTGGNADGILLYGIKQNSMFKDMGIQNGDIIMGVDGTEIKSVEDAVSLYDRLKNSSDINMQIRRRGQVKEISYHVE
ncbi:MAG: PDZ domain-containing protein [Desulfamplus sp.]|nr:PDZ domain-containing protein [Desulfamplus sp.]